MRFTTLLLRLSALVLTLLVAVPLLFVCLLQIQSGRNFVSSVASTLASTDQQTVQIRNLYLDFGLNAQISEVSLSDEAGPWMTAKDISLAWHPMRLLTGTLDISQLAASQIDLNRLPQTPPAAEESTDTKPSNGGGFSLPVNIALGDLAVAEINLGEALIGAPVSIKVAGSGAVARDPALLTADLSVDRIDGIVAGLAATATFKPSQNTLTFDISLSEPRGGLAARVLEVPDLPSVDLTLKGAGPLTDWQAELSLALDGHTTVTGSANIEETQAGRSLAFDLDGDLTQISPPAAQAFVQGTTHASGKALLTADFKPVAGELDLKTGTVALTAEGKLSDNALAAKGALKISAGDNVLVALDIADQRFAFGPITADFSVSGTQSAADWHANLALASLQSTQARLRDAKLRLSGNGANLGADALTSPVLLDLSVAELQGLTDLFAPLTGPLSVKGDGSVDGTGNAMRFDQLAISSAAASLVLTDTHVSPEGLKSAGRLSVNDLAKFSALAGRAIGGKVDGTFSADIAPADWTGDAEASLELAGLKSGDTRLDALFAESSKLDTQFQLAGLSNISVQSLTLSSAAMSVEAQATLEEHTLSSKISASLPELAKIDPQLAGGVALDVTTSGPLTALQIAANASSKRILLAGTPLDDLKFEAEGTANRSAPSAVVKTSASLNGQPIAVDVELSSNDGGAELNPLRLELAGNSIDGALSVGAVSDPLTTLRGDLEIDAPDLSSLSPLLLTAVSGHLKGTLSADPDRQSLSLDIKGGDVDLPAISIGDIAMKAGLTAPYSPETVNANIVLSDILTDATPVHALQLTARPEGGKTAISADLKLDQGNRDGLALSAYFSNTDAGAYLLEVAQLVMDYQGISSNLIRPANITHADGETTLTPFALQLGSGSLSIEGTAGSALDLRATLASVPLTLANAFVPSLGLGGTLSGSINASGAPSAPEANWKLTGSGLTANELKSNGLAALGLSSNGSLVNGTIQQQTSISDPNGLQLTASGTVGTAQPNPLNISVNGTVPTATLRRPMLDAGLRGEGAIAIEGAVSGPATSPAYQLTASPSGLKLTSLSTGLTLQNIRGSATVSQVRASINDVTGDLATGGTLRASGTVGMKDGFPADLSIALNDGRYVDPGLVTALVGAQVTITGPLASQNASALIAGTISIDKADITIPESLPGAVSPVDVQHVHASQAILQQVAELGGGPKQTQTQQKSVPPRLDILLSAPGQIFIRGRGLDTELQGSLKIVGTTADPQAIGAFSLKRGQLDILTRRLVFSRGSATFEGSLTPTIDFAATTTVDSTAITVTVSGEADDPEISFTSSPELPQDEVLALLLFGKSVGNLSATQVARLAAAIATLTGGSDNGPLASIRKSLGLDAIDINTDGDDGPSLAVGKYINDNIYLGVEQGTGSNSSRVKVDIDLDRGLKVRGEVGADGSSKAGIFFEREY